MASSIPTNELDKLANAFKSGDVGDIIESVKGIFESLEDRIGDLGDVVEDSIGDAKKELRRELSKAKRRLLREARHDLKKMQAEFGETLAEAMRDTISDMVEAEVEKRMAAKDSAAE